MDLSNSVRDVPHRFVATTVIDLPADVQVSATFQANSGDPFNITTGNDENGDGQRNDRPRHR